MGPFLIKPLDSTCIRAIPKISSSSVHKTPYTWHQSSAKARIAAKNDRGELAVVNESLVLPSAIRVQKNLEQLLDAELAFWERVDQYAEQNARGVSDETAFQAMATAAINFSGILSAHKGILQAGLAELEAKDRTELTSLYTSCIADACAVDGKLKLARIGRGASASK